MAVAPTYSNPTPSDSKPNASSPDSNAKSDHSYSNSQPNPYSNPPSSYAYTNTPTSTTDPNSSAMIYCGICSYRDSELKPTVEDMLATAKWPQDLRIGIFSQGDEGTGFTHDSRFRLMKCPWQEAQGLGWARANVQSMYGGEDFYLQLDSHHRFEKHWDETLIQMVELTGDPKPIIGTYAGIYEPGNPSLARNPHPCKMVADEFTPSGTIKFKPHYIEGYQDLDKPIRARFCSGHFSFTVGKFLEEYKFDPEIFFGGEEISMAIRGFTLGYSLWHPHRQVIYHEFIRTHRNKIWGDHNKDSGLTPWGERERISKQRIRKLLREQEGKDAGPNHEELGVFDLGTVRTHREYELYAGINFAERTLTQEAHMGTEPPTGKDGTEVDPDKDETYYALEDAKGTILHRWMNPLENQEPVKLVKWERSKSHGWGKRTDYKL